MRIKQLGERNFLSVEWNDENNTLNLLDQRKIPEKISIKTYIKAEEVSLAIKEMVVRGAPAIGATGAYGLVLALKEAQFLSKAEKKEHLDLHYSLLLSSRPTAVDLKNCLDRVYSVIIKNDYSFDIALEESKKISCEIIEECKKIGIEGNKLIEYNDAILTHCNAGGLATIDYGTALAPIFEAHNQGKNITVYVDETRPRLQGGKITAWELEQVGIKHQIIVDSSVAHFMSKKKINKVIVGADRCLKDGSIVNKIGTQTVAIVAKYFVIPFYTAFPLTTLDVDPKSSVDTIEIEYRGESELKEVQIEDKNYTILNAKSSASNPAFDITSNALIEGYITSLGVIKREDFPLFLSSLKF